MPLYEYECEACRHRFEKIQRFSDPLVSVCPSCGQGPVNKLLSAPAFQFKGTGWYVTDYAGKKSDGTPSSDPGNDSKSERDSDSKSDSKSEGKSDNTSSQTEGKSETKSDASPSSTASTAPSTPSSPEKK